MPEGKSLLGGDGMPEAIVRYRTDRPGRHGPEPGPQHERPRLSRWRCSTAPFPRWTISSTTKPRARRWWARIRWRSSSRLLKTPAARHADGQGRRRRRPDDRRHPAATSKRATSSSTAAIRIHRLQPPHQRPCGKGHSLHRHRRLRRRGRRAPRPLDHARRQSRRVAACEGDLPGHRRQGRRRHALLRLGGRRRRRATT